MPEVPRTQHSIIETGQVALLLLMAAKYFLGRAILFPKCFPQHNLRRAAKSEKATAEPMRQKNSGYSHSARIG
jgi:hypothetical protein